MSSYDGGGFEEWLEDSFMGTIPEETWMEIRSLMEPHREDIENALEGYESDACSWRDFRNRLWDRYEAESAKISAMLRAPKKGA